MQVENAKGLNLDEITISLEGIAHIHALSYAYGYTNKIDWQKKCPGTYSKMIEDEELEKAAVANFDLFKTNLKEKDASQELIDGVDKLAANYKNIFSKFTSVGDSRFLIHGDYWSNNVMFGPNNSETFQQ